jgi:hypothetical protein
MWKHLNIHHFCIVSQDIIRWSPIAFKYGGTSTPSSLNPIDTVGLENLMDCWSVLRPGLDHPSDNPV